MAELFSLLKFRCSDSKCYSVVGLTPTCLCACLRMLGDAPDEADGVLRDLPTDLEWGSLSYWILDNQNNGPEVFYWIYIS